MNAPPALTLPLEPVVESREREADGIDDPKPRRGLVAPRNTRLQGDVRTSHLWQRWQALRSTAHQTGDPDDIAKAGDAWDDWLESYLPNPADRVPIPRPVIAVGAHNACP
jgi:hypothetical protein